MAEPGVARGSEGPQGKAGKRSPVEVSQTTIKRILTRTSGYLTAVSSHSLQPYAGCSYGKSLCGVGCYVQHSPWLLKGRRWGEFLEVRANAPEAYLREAAGERRWARKARERFSIFMSSATDPFPPQERQFRLTRQILQAMLSEPPDTLILQTHSARITDELDLLVELSRLCALRVHISVETDRERLPGLPPPASGVDARLQAAALLRQAGLQSVVTVSPLLPIADPAGFFRRIEHAASAVVVDHFVGGDGSAEGARTLRTGLPAAMEALEPGSSRLAYRDRMVEIARTVMPGRVGVHIAGFAGVYE